MLPPSMSDELVQQIIAERRAQAISRMASRASSQANGRDPRQQCGRWLARLSRVIDPDAGQLDRPPLAPEPLPLK
jgi:hypothetical protein